MLTQKTTNYFTLFEVIRETRTPNSLTSNQKLRYTHSYGYYYINLSFNLMIKQPVKNLTKQKKKTV